MKQYFKSMLVLLVTVNMLSAQREVVFTKSFETNQTTSAIFNLSNTSIIIEASKDEQLHFDFALEFKGYSKNEIREQLAGIAIEATKFDNHITLMANSVSKIGNISYTLATSDELVLKFNAEATKKQEIYRKSKDAIISEINAEGFTGSSMPSDYVDRHFKVKTKNGELKNITDENVKIIKSYFVIKIPASLKLNINATESQIRFKSDVYNELAVFLNRGDFSAALLSNPYNSIKIENAGFKAHILVGGTYDFNTVSRALIGSLENVNLNSEFSKLELGEVGKQVKINDYNSEYWFYNWSSDFKRFDLRSEYSKIHLFFPETNDFRFKVVGNNTINHLNNVSINMQPTSKGEKFNMMERKPNGKSEFAGEIYFDIVHGIIYSHDDTLVDSKN